jgi:hypothetical protein
LEPHIASQFDGACEMVIVSLGSGMSEGHIADAVHHRRPIALRRSSRRTCRKANAQRDGLWGQPAARRRPYENHPQVDRVWSSSASTSAQAIAAGTAVRRQQLQFLAVTQCPHGLPGRGGEFGDPDLCYDCDGKASRNVRCKLVSRGDTWLRAQPVIRRLGR